MPAWLVFDGTYRGSYRLGPLGRRDPDPDWLARGDTLGELAAQIGVPDPALAQTVERFNDGARDGVDPDFGRGSLSLRSLHRRYRSAERAAVLRGAGPARLPGHQGRAADGRVGPRAVRSSRAADPGLYAAGNAAASAFGLCYPGAGGTIGPALVFGLRAGDAAAGDG